MKKWNGLDDAVIGVGSRCGMDDEVLIYDRDKMHTILMEKQGMDSDDAHEWICYNIEGAYIGNDTPITMRELDEGELD